MTTPGYYPSKGSGGVSASDIAILDRGHSLPNATETMSRVSISGNFNLTAGQLTFAYFTPRINRTLATVKTYTAAATPTAMTLVRIGLYSADPSTGDLTLIASTANDTTLFAAASTAYARALTVATGVTKGSRYAWGLLQVGGATPPKLYGQITVGAVNSDLPIIAAAVASQTDLPSTVTAASLTSTTGMAFVAGY